MFVSCLSLTGMCAVRGGASLGLAASWGGWGGGPPPVPCCVRFRAWSQLHCFPGLCGDALPHLPVSAAEFVDVGVLTRQWMLRDAWLSSPGLSESHLGFPYPGGRVSGCACKDQFHFYSFLWCLTVDISFAQFFSIHFLQTFFPGGSLCFWLSWGGFCFDFWFGYTAFLNMVTVIFSVLQPVSF